MLSTLTRLVAGAILSLVLVGCASSTTGSIISVTINDGDQSIAVGDTHRFTATVATSGNASDTVTWNSSNENVATIDADGNVTGLTAGSTAITATSTADPSKNDSITLTVDPPGTLHWTRQFGTSDSDEGLGIATDVSGNVYATGYTAGALEGANSSASDAFIRSYDSNGTLRWTRQFGTSETERALGLTTDTNGNVYATGRTSGALEGTNAGSNDAFLRSYDSDGNLRWTRQFGTSDDDQSYGVATDANGNIYATGITSGALVDANAGNYDAFLRSYDTNGTLRWTRQFGTSTDDQSYGVATDANGNIYIAGYTTGDLESTNTGNLDAFIRSYDSNGTLRWTHQFGTSTDDRANGVATDASNDIYIAGYTTGDLEGLNTGNVDAIIRSYDSDGTLRWTRQFGTSSTDTANAIATDASGNIYATGASIGSLEGTNAGSYDAFIRSYDSDGTLRWTRQFGTSSTDTANAIATDASGDLYAIGWTGGALAGINAGSTDAFIRKYGP